MKIIYLHLFLGRSKIIENSCFLFLLPHFLNTGWALSSSNSFLHYLIYSGNPPIFVRKAPSIFKSFNVVIPSFPFWFSDFSLAKVRFFFNKQQQIVILLHGAELIWCLKFTMRKKNRMDWVTSEKVDDLN